MNTPASGIADPYSLDIADIDPADPVLFETQTHWDYFKRLREEDPVHFVEGGEFGPYWCITKFDDIVFVDTHHDIFSSMPAIGIVVPQTDFEPPMFIAMDPPKHDDQRKAVMPAVMPQRLAEMEGLCR